MSANLTSQTFISYIPAGGLLVLNVKYGEQSIQIPFNTTESSPAVIIHWQGSRWYNSIVADNTPHASPLKIKFDDTVAALRW